MLPLVLLVGSAGSGKDTVADFLVKNHQAIAIAQADPLKRLAQYIFDFSNEQLWGPSSKRNEVDSREFFQRFNIVLNGRGNETVISLLSELIKGTNVSLCDAMDSLNRWYNSLINENPHVSPRKVLQTLGTEWGRDKVVRDLWINFAKRNALELLSGNHIYDHRYGLTYDVKAPIPSMVVITDGRFANEIISIKRDGGIVLKISCPQSDGSEAEKAGILGHTSESEQRRLPKTFFDYILTNDKSQGLSVLEEKVATFNNILSLFRAEF